MEIYRDYFTAEHLLLSLSAAQYIPGQLGESGLFETIPLTGTTLAIEANPDDDGAALTAVPRGTASKVETLERRAVHTFTTAHYRVDGAVYADEVLNARGMGVTAAGEIITSRRDRVMARMRRDIDLTLEYLRLSCLITPTNTFGTVPAGQVIALATDATKTRQEVFNKIIAPMETALGGLPFTGIQVWCSDTYWAALIENKAFKDSLLNYTAAQQLRGDPRERIAFGGCTWERYRGAGSLVITTGAAIAVPTGVPSLFVQAFAPADTLDQVGAQAQGAPYYPQAILSADNRKWHLELQTNPVMVCTRPTAVLTTTLS